MKTKIYIIFLTLLSLTSCNDWLNVIPQGQVEADDMLTTEKGYNAALGGIYYTLSSSSMYGKELSYGMMDMLAQYWDVSNTPDHSYYKLAQYDYKNSESIAKFNSIWKNFYSAIAQCNLILSKIGMNRNDIKYSGLIEGEAYALRAFCHMELFRLFGPVIKTDADLNKLSIAYRTEFNVTVNTFESGRSILTKVREDLLKALELMKDDPINLVGRRGDYNSSLLDYIDVINRRGSRLNYYGVLGLLARNEQLLLNQDQAYIYAKRIIDECKETKVLSLIDKTNIESGTEAWKDLNYSTEMLFALYTNNLYDLTDAAFMMNGKGKASNSFVINSNLYTVFLNDLYGRQPDGAGTDNRLRYWFKGNEYGYYDLTKLQKAYEASGMAAAYDPEVPIMRMSEVYYIACEAQIGKNNDLALSYLNDVRETRNLVRLEGTFTDNVLLDYMVRDQRKDFIGEGRMFPLYKRLFLDIHVKTGLEIAADENKFVFPIPDAEYEYSSNEKATNK